MERREMAAAIRRTRLHLGLTQRALAARADVSVRTVRALETAPTAAPRFETLDRLASALDLDPVARARLLSGTARESALCRSAEPADDTHDVWIGATAEPVPEPFADDLRRFAESATLLHVDQTVWVNAARTRVRDTCRLTVRAGDEQLTHLPVMCLPEGRRPVQEVVDLDGCVIDDSVTTDSGLRIVRLALDRPAAANDIFTLGYSRVRRSGFGSSPAVDYVGTRLRTPTQLYTLRVHFDRRTLPRRVHRCVQASPDSPRRALRSLTPSPAGVALLAIEKPRPVRHMLRWEW